MRTDIMEQILKILAPPVSRQVHGLAPEILMELVAPMMGKFDKVSGKVENAGDDTTVKGTLVMSALMHGTWSKEFRKTSHMLYMAYCERLHGEWEKSLPMKLKDHSYLPSHAELAILTETPANNGWGEPPLPYDKTAERARLCGSKFDVFFDTEKLLDPDYISVEEVFLMLDPFDTKTFTKLHFFCEKNGFCNVLNREMIESLAERLTLPPTKKKHQNKIVEVGAGSGRLTHFLKQYNVPNIVATDANPEGYIAGYSTEKFPVEKAGYEEVVARYNPHILLCSWMPEGTDWSSVWREQHIHEYLLLGEPYAGQSGTAWETFGLLPENHFPLPSWLGGTAIETLPPNPPFAQDGYTQCLNSSVGKWMVGQRDRSSPTTACVEFTKIESEYPDFL
eukprot:TRINITY_DN12143_c0_g1_i1.p1 TRINITY_DN12143_c0_g1~~TRINITY_DN12143_c0_g1_i1.p1  ORF type:complete len:400 (+),score=52.15 TRINITY_DN12143_c0_g1_i1:23-1201(+)